MKQHALKIWLVLLGLFGGFMFLSVVSLKAAETSTADPCTDTSIIYNNQDLGTEDVMTLYHKTINEKFNEYIKKMIKALPGDPNAAAPETETECTQENFSTFCVARDLLTNPQYGYMVYSKALSCRRTALFDGTKERNAWTAYQDAMIMGDANEKRATAIYQAQKALEVSARLEAITREQTAAKRALDQTLSAYNELKVAWPMHKKYIEIYNSLLVYRDKLVEIRNQVEEFPGKFIDATTTKCI